MEKMSDEMMSKVEKIKYEIADRVYENSFASPVFKDPKRFVILELRKDIDKYAAAYLDEAMKLIVPKKKPKEYLISDGFNTCRDEILANVEKFKRGGV